MRDNSFNKLVTLLETVEPTLNANPPRIEEDHEVRMGIAQVEAAVRNAQVIHRILRSLPAGTDLPGWIQSKLTMADDYLVNVADHMRSVVGEDTGEAMGFSENSSDEGSSGEDLIKLKTRSGKRLVVKRVTNETENPPGDPSDSEAPNSGGDLTGFMSTDGEEPSN